MARFDSDFIALRSFHSFDFVSFHFSIGIEIAKLSDGIVLIINIFMLFTIWRWICKKN